jgi:bifunctional N-acetylglucosamine-1-phosphate-uridyltransferase/glucosamine-1-phosphate-acetyltransferase GlmU-like protein
MLDLRAIETFSMTYIFTDEDGDEMAYEYEQVGTPVVLPDGQSIRLALKDINEANEDDEEYLFTLIQTADDEFSVKSTYFEDPEELYGMNVELTDEEVCFSSISDGEEMYLYGFFA